MVVAGGVKLARGSLRGASIGHEVVDSHIQPHARSTQLLKRRFFGMVICHFPVLRLPRNSEEQKIKTGFKHKTTASPENKNLTRAMATLCSTCTSKQYCSTYLEIRDSKNRTAIAKLAHPTYKKRGPYRFSKTTWFSISQMSERGPWTTCF